MKPWIKIWEENKKGVQNEIIDGNKINTINKKINIIMNLKVKQIIKKKYWK